MKKMLSISLLVVLALVLVSTVVSAATTKADLEAYLTSGHKIAGKTVSLTANEIKQVKDYFAANEITDAQAAAIKANVDKAIAVMEKAGVSEYTKLTAAQKEETLTYVKAAAAEVGLTINTANNTAVDANGDVVFKAEAKALVQTGSSNVVYVVLAGLAIIAVAGTVAVRKANA